MATRRFYSWVSHYMPVWMALLLVILPILFSNMIRPRAPVPKSPEPFVEETDPAPPPPRWIADVNLGLLSFWMWALITNGHDGRLVRSSGQKEATDPREKQQELAVILLFLGFTLAAYLACNAAIPVWVALIGTGFMLMLPVIVLEKPEP